MATLELETPLRLDHLAIWVEDIEKTAAFLTDIVGWKRHPMVVEVSDDDPTCGGMKAVFIDGNGLWLELIQPTTPGPGMDILEKKGAGTIVEVNFEAVGSDYGKVLEGMEEAGIQMLSMDGSPLVDDGRISEGVQGKAETAETGQHIAYWPVDMTGGTTIEVYARDMADETNLLNVRDEMWKEEKPDPESPRINHCAVMVKDLEQTAQFYTGIMGLKRSPANFDIAGEDNEAVGSMDISFIYTNTEGVWLELVQPKGPGPVMDYLLAKGEGHVAELVVEVEDLANYYDRMKAKGVQLLNIDGTPLGDDEKYHVLAPHGEKIAYFPSDVACGMTIEVIERGPRETSIMHRLYDRPPA